MADQSNFSRLPKKQLFYISDKIIDSGFQWKNLTYNYFDEYEEHEAILQNIASYFGESVVEEDVQFFAKFLDINDDLLSQIFESNDKSLIEQLVVPEARDYLVEYTVMGDCTFIEYYDTKISSYDKDWVIGSLHLQENDGNWDFYSGKIKNTQYDNWETSGWEIDKVKEIDNVSESRNPKRLLENTEKLIPKLDKETLVKLKYIIDKQLRSF